MAIDHRRIVQISELQVRKPAKLLRFEMEDGSERMKNQDSVRFCLLLLAWRRDAKRSGIGYRCRETGMRRDKNTLILSSVQDRRENEDRSSPFLGTDGLGSIWLTDSRSIFGLPYSRHNESGSGLLPFTQNEGKWTKIDLTVEKLTIVRSAKTD